MSATHSFRARDRNHWLMPLAVVTAGAMLAGWFPLGALIRQQSQLDAARSQLNAVQQQQRSLALQAQSMDSRTAAIQLAREQYQLVAPGQSLIQVLPGLGSGLVAQSTGDPGLQPLVAPSSAPASATSAPVTNAGVMTSSHGFVSRFMRTLEFWR